MRGPIVGQLCVGRYRETKKNEEECHGSLGLILELVSAEITILAATQEAADEIIAEIQAFFFAFFFWGRGGFQSAISKKVSESNLESTSVLADT